ncbi:MAG: DUF951 domain-containing protein [Clostridiales bacterium]|nr:DUF951 domain-containing protein [Clostridiales bacterium]
MILKFLPQDTLIMKKNHPCGGNRMRVLVVGSDIKVKCETCGHDVIVPRVKLEKNIKQVIKSNENGKNE